MNSLRSNDIRGATRTFAMGGNILFCKCQCGGVRGGFPPFLKIFQKQKCLKFKVEKKGNFKFLHADLPVFNSNRFFVLMFLQNLYFEQL